VNRARLQEWLDRYVDAWKSYDPDKIGALFSEDAEYRYAPEDEPVRGRAAIVEDWLSERDEPGTYDAHYEPLASGDGYDFAHGTTSYFDAAGNLNDKYWNLFVCRFNDAGECTEFTEYWMQARQFRPSGAGEA
jgi:ketosteroid isomerase-like protein